jgi:integrase
MNYNKIKFLLNEKKITIHKARHTFASILISKNIDILTISNLLGHERVSTTLDVYGHLMPGMKEKAVELL